VLLQQVIMHGKTNYQHALRLRSAPSPDHGGNLYTRTHTLRADTVCVVVVLQWYCKAQFAHAIAYSARRETQKVCSMNFSILHYTVTISDTEDRKERGRTSLLSILLQCYAQPYNTTDNPKHQTFLV